MKILLLCLVLFTLSNAGNFTLKSDDLLGQLTSKQEFSDFGCNGKNISPALNWSNAPKGTKSFAIVMYDPDAPTGSGWWHWLLVNIPKSVNSLASNASTTSLMPKGSFEAMNDYGTKGFGGACPPKGDAQHRYIITIHALDIEKLDVDESTNQAVVGFMINAHTIGKSSLISYYGR